MHMKGQVRLFDFLPLSAALRLYNFIKYQTEITPEIYESSLLMKQKKNVEISK